MRTFVGMLFGSFVFGLFMGEHAPVWLAILVGCSFVVCGIAGDIFAK